MSIFDKIKNALWRDDKQPAKPTQTATTASTPVTASVTSPASAPAAPSAAPAPAAAPAADAPLSTQATQNNRAPSAPETSIASEQPTVDIAAVLDAAVEQKGQKLDWRHSIVDLMKALDLDSSLSDRKKLAAELNYTGDTSDSATMNVWLHEALMKRLAENGGKVPAELAD
jgi:hypothetical protein